MSRLTMNQASTILDTALSAARSRSLKPMTVVVLDAGGHLVAAKREDDSGILRFDIAFGKAYGALGFGMGSRAVAARGEQGPLFMTAAMAASGGRVVPVAGGLLIRDAGGTILGAAGLSGDTSDADEACGVIGIEAAGLVADTGA